MPACGPRPCPGCACPHCLQTSVVLYGGSACADFYLYPQRVVLSFEFPFYGHPLRQITIATGGKSGSAGPEGGLRDLGLSSLGTGPTDSYVGSPGDSR